MKILFVLLSLRPLAIAQSWFDTSVPPPPPPPPSLSRSVLQAVGGAALLLESKHCKHTALFMQAVNLVAWPAIETASVTLGAAWANVTVAANSLSEEEKQEAEVELLRVRALLSSTRQTMAETMARWRNGTLDSAAFAYEMKYHQASAAALAKAIASADSTLSFVAAAAQQVDPMELYATLSTPLAALASSLALSTSASAAAILNGCPLGADVSRVAFSQASALAARFAPPMTMASLEDAFTPLSAQKRRWALAALDAASAAVGYIIARKAKATAATLAAAALGATALVSSARRLGGDSLVLEAYAVAKENGVAEWLPFDLEWPPAADALASPGDDSGTRALETWLDASWQQLRLVLIVVGLLYQLTSAERLPLLLRLFIWPLLVFEGWLEALSAANAAMPMAVRHANSAPTVLGGGGAAAAAADEKPAAAAKSTATAARATSSPARSRSKKD